MTTCYFKVLKRTPAHKAQLALETLWRGYSKHRADALKQLALPKGVTLYTQSDGRVSVMKWPEGVPVPSHWKCIDKEHGIHMPRASAAAGKTDQAILNSMKFPDKNDVMKAFLGQDIVPMVMIHAPGGRGFMLPSVGYNHGKGRMRGIAFISAHTAILRTKGVKPIEGLQEVGALEYEKATGLKDA